MTGTGTPRTPRTPDSTRRSERSRRAIYEAALSLVGEAGYARTTIEGIAARAGVGKQTIYRWWPSKAAVLLEAFIDLGEQAAKAAGSGDGVYEFPDTGDLAADLRTVLRATVDELVDPRYEAPTRALTAAGRRRPPWARSSWRSCSNRRSGCTRSGCARRRRPAAYGTGSTRASRGAARRPALPPLAAAHPPAHARVRRRRRRLRAWRSRPAPVARGGEFAHGAAGAVAAVRAVAAGPRTGAKVSIAPPLCCRPAYPGWELRPPEAQDGGSMDSTTLR